MLVSLLILLTEESLLNKSIPEIDCARWYKIEYPMTLNRNGIPIDPSYFICRRYYK